MIFPTTAGLPERLWGDDRWASGILPNGDGEMDTISSWRKCSRSLVFGIGGGGIKGDGAEGILVLRNNGRRSSNDLPMCRESVHIADAFVILLPKAFSEDHNAGMGTVAVGMCAVP